MCPGYGLRAHAAGFSTSQCKLPSAVHVVCCLCRSVPVCVSYGLRKDAEGSVDSWPCKVFFRIIRSVQFWMLHFAVAHVCFLASVMQKEQCALLYMLIRALRIHVYAV